ncbi:alpha-L-rhamnosidase [Chitinophaga costaii]|uniref:alpha-L-rhamnosidase n=1 Tax=Chitinophaga costaii TaxID=1335309 RepID=A0A1C3Z0C6_9BACT|nr:glycoside hydrolase family 78 protein [Chitinophaga costaii]PUZ30178.1 alpha-rhamnosidase [Chitinophaga costaii]SCB75733.1 alpha-L-rhamnosidase [Chitinophaga costaii]
MKNSIALVIACTLLLSFTHRSTPSIMRLRCEYADQPQGIDITTPRLSWELQSSARGVRQTAYQIMVASSLQALNREHPDLWDSKQVNTAQSLNIPYAGKPLTTGMHCFWKVKVWTQDGKSSGWSSPASWTMGLLQPSDWKAMWIGLDSTFAWERPKDTATRLSARYLRKDFAVNKKVKQATAYISGLGLYELYINGQKTGHQVMAPGPTEYNKRVFYNTFDITPQLQSGQNTIGVILGNGRFFTMRSDNITNYGFPKLLCQLNITYEDGSTTQVVSDESWKVTAAGPIVANNEYDGETYDATKELTGWNQPGYDASAWLPAQGVQKPCDKVVAQLNNNITIMDTVKAVRRIALKPGVFIFDMGQNMVGWIHLRVKGNRGNQVQLRFAERLQKDSTLYTDNLRSAKVTDTYTLKGGGTEIWEPRFSYHGFRYVEVSGYPGTPTLDDLEGRVIYDEMNNTGYLETGNATLNQVYKNAWWGIRGNYRGMPTDCPQRDERMGWTGDRVTGSRGESFLFDNHLLYAKWLQDLEDTQTPEGSLPDVAPSYWKIYSDNMTWPGAFIIIANMLYEQYGDDAPIRQHYPAMKKWMTYMQQHYMKDYILTKDTYGDWCVPPESPEMILSKDPARITPGEFLGTSFYYHLLQHMQRFARLSGQDADVAAYAALAAKVKDAFHHKFYHAAQGFYANNTPTANIFSLAYGLAPDSVQARVFNNVATKTMTDYKGHISTGLVGAEWLMRTLTQYGRGDIAYQLATNTTYPSWGYMAQNGATTIWELWNGDTANPGMNSGNHVMLLGDLLIWCYQDLGAIAPDTSAAGYKKIILKPLLVKDLTHVTARYHSSYGWVKSAWEIKDQHLHWNITVPANTTATVYVPTTYGTQVTENNKAIATGNANVQFLRQENGFAVYAVNSGDYSFATQ